MPADVVEAADPAVIASERYDGLAEKVEAVIVADGRNIVLVADELPARAENGLLLRFEEFRIAVDPGGQAPAGVVHGRGGTGGSLLNERTILLNGGTTTTPGREETFRVRRDNRGGCRGGARGVARRGRRATAASGLCSVAACRTPALPRRRCSRPLR